MRRLTLLLFLLPILARGQGQGNTVTIPYSSDPTGAVCSFIMRANYNGNDYFCGSGVFVKVGTGAGGVTSITGTANQIVVTGTTTPTLSLANPINVSTSSQVSAPPFQLGTNRGSNLSPVFAASPNWTTAGSGCTETAGAMACTSTSGSAAFHPTTALTPVIGQTYQVDAVLSAWTAGTVSGSFCGVSFLTMSPAAASDFRVYVTCTSTATLSVSVANSSTMTFSSVTAKRAAYDSTSGANVSIVIDTNSGLTVPLVVYQPIATAGWTYEEYTIAAYAIIVKTANGTDTWEWGTSTYTGSLTFAATRQTFLTVVSFVTGYWDIAGINGSVTPA